MTTGGLSGKRVLVVEDEYFIAADLRRALATAGATVLGPVGGLDGALALADLEPLDAAILDINLDGAKSFPVADRLRAAGVPFLFLSGYDRSSLPLAYRDAPNVTKPFDMDAVLARLALLASTGPPA